MKWGRRWERHYDDLTDLHRSFAIRGGIATLAMVVSVLTAFDLLPWPGKVPYLTFTVGWALYLFVYLPGQYYYLWEVDDGE